MSRERLPDTRQSITHKGNVAGAEFYITVGKFPDGRPGEVFIKIGKEGSTMSGVYDFIGIAISMLFQTGWTITQLASKFKDVTFVPCGKTSNKDIPDAKSIVDYIFRWLEKEFPEKDE